MEIFCESCGKQINIPDEKIPAGRPFSLRCPACKQKIQVEAPGTPGKSTDIPAGGRKSFGEDAPGIPGLEKARIYQPVGGNHPARTPPAYPAHGPMACPGKPMKACRQTR